MKLLSALIIAVSALVVNAQIELLFSVLETSACAALCYHDSCSGSLTSTTCFCQESEAIKGCVRSDCGSDILTLVLHAVTTLCGTSSLLGLLINVDNGNDTTVNPTSAKTSSQASASLSVSRKLNGNATLSHSAGTSSHSLSTFSTIRANTLSTNNSFTASSTGTTGGLASATPTNTGVLPSQSGSAASKSRIIDGRVMECLVALLVIFSVCSAILVEYS